MPKPTKTGPSRIPLPQRERIKQRFIAGQTVRQISREEGRSRETVDRIVKSEDVANYVRDMRAKFVGLGQDALLAVQRAVRDEGDARLAYELLKDIGVVPNREERNAAPTEQSAGGYDEEAEVNKMMGRLIQTAVERARVFGTRCPELEADLEKVGGRINYETATIEPIAGKS
jgi:hypothetical protein